MLINFILNFISVVCIFYIFYKVWYIKKNVTRKLESINKLNKIILDQVQDLHVETQNQFDSFNHTINSQSKKILEIEKKNLDQASNNLKLVTQALESLNMQNFSPEKEEIVTGGIVSKESLPAINNDYVIPSHGKTERMQKETYGVEDISEGGLPPALGNKSHSSFNNETAVFNPMQEQIKRNMSIKKSGN